MRIGVVADDLTGACDSSVAFLAMGSVGVTLWPAPLDPAWNCIAISTESRSESPQTSFDRSQKAMATLAKTGVDLLFRKVDSQMRGNMSADLAGALTVANAGCVLAPALPEERRTTIDGHQRWPDGDIDLITMLRDAGIEARLGSPADARAGLVIVCDATTVADLQGIAIEIARAEPRPLIAGTAGLASWLPAAFGFDNSMDHRWSPCHRPLAIVGTPAAMAQARAAIESGREVIVVGPDELPVSLDGHDGILVTGGETAARVMRWLGAETIELRGEVQPRVPVGLCVGGWHDGMPIAVKSGSFGTDQTITLALEALERGS
jgi:uncharacterized protein YgbK (DUF1537 family)